MGREGETAARILAVLRTGQKPLSISAVARMTGIERHTAAHHLEILRLSGSVEFLHHGKAKKYYRVDHHYAGQFSVDSPDLIVLLDAHWNILDTNDGRFLHTDGGRAPGSPKKLDSLSHPALRHPDFLSCIHEARSHRVFHRTLISLPEQGGASYQVTITRIGIPRIGQSYLIIIETDPAGDKFRTPLGREVADDLSSGIVVADLSGSITYVNPWILTNTGYDSITGIAGQNILEVFGFDPRQLTRTRDDDTVLPYFHETSISRRDGTSILCLMHWEVIRSPENQPLYLSGLMINLPARDDLRERVATLNTRFRHLAENIPDIIWETGPDFRYTYISPSLTAVTGLLPEDLNGTEPSWIADPDRGSEVRRLLEQASQGAIPGIIREHRIRDKNGREVIVETRAAPIFSPSGEFVGFSGIDRDITERIRAADALRESEQKYRTLIENANEAIAVVQDLRFIFFNPRLVEIGGYSPEELRKQPILSFVHPEDRENVRRNHRMLMEGKRITEPYIVRIITKAKEWKWLDIKATPITWKGRPATLNFYADITGLKETGMALDAARQELRFILDTVPAMIWQKDTGGRYVMVNRAFCETTGLAESAIIGRTDHEIFPAEIAARYRSDDARVLTSRTPLPPTEEQYRTVSGESGWSLTEKQIWYGSSGTVKGTIGFAKDITDRKQAEDALRESEMKYRRIFEGASEGILVAEIATGQFLHANPMICRMLGYTHDELVAKGIRDIHRNEDHPVVLEEFGLLASGRKSRAEKIPCLRRDGTILVADIVCSRETLDGKECIIAFFTDITERQRAGQALMESEEKYRALFAAESDALFVLDQETGTILDANRAASELYGYPQEELAGRPVAELSAEQDIDGGFTGRPEQKVILRHHRKKDGTIFPVEIQAGPVSLRGRRVIVAAVREVTERLQHDEALRRANRQLNLVMSITRHDIRNALTSLKALLELSKSTAGEKERMLEYIAEEEMLANLIGHQILLTREYNDLGIHPPVWQNLASCLDAAMNGIELSGCILEAGGLDRVEVMADPLLKKVFFNLIDNAVRHGGPGMTRILISTHRSEGGLRIICEDNGYGIPGEEKARIFERGYGKHTGFGLFLIREILGMTGISIVENGNPAGGARFEMTVPPGAFRCAAG